MGFISEDVTNSSTLQNFPEEDIWFFKYYLAHFCPLLTCPGFIFIFGPKTKERTLASVESHKDRPTGFKMTAAELATSDGGQSSLRLVYKELVYNSSAVCTLPSKSWKPHASKSAQIYRVYPLVSFPQTWRGSLPHCLRLHKLNPPDEPGWTQWLCHWHSRWFCFPDAAVRSFWLPSMRLFLRWSRKKSHTRGEVRQIPHYFTSSGSSISFHFNLLCFLSRSFLKWTSNHVTGGTAALPPAMLSPTEKRPKQLSDQLASWSPGCRQTPKLFDPNLQKDMRHGREGIFVIVCLKNELKLKLVLFSNSELGNNMRLVSCSPNAFVFLPFGVSTSGRRMRSEWTSH